MGELTREEQGGGQDQRAGYGALPWSGDMVFEQVRGIFFLYFSKQKPHVIAKASENMDA